MRPHGDSPPAPKRAAALAAAALMLLAGGGCGSTGKSHPSGSGASPGGEAAATARTSATNAAGTGSTSTSGSSGLHAIGAPKYGTPPASAPVQSGTVNVAYRLISIQPDTLKVKVGTTVRWTNYDPVDHNVTSQSGPQRFASQNFGEGSSFSVKLTRPGVVHYLCTIHPASMNGTIVVVK